MRESGHLTHESYQAMICNKEEFNKVDFRPFSPELVVGALDPKEEEVAVEVPGNTAGIEANI